MVILLYAEIRRIANLVLSEIIPFEASPTEKSDQRQIKRHDAVF